MRKHLFLCEGQDDTDLITAVLRKQGSFSQTAINTFNQDTDAAKHQLPGKETKLLRQFFDWTPHNPYDALIKSEAGQDKLRHVHKNILFQCLREQSHEHRLTYVVLIDTDEAPPQRFVQTLHDEACENKPFDADVHELHREAVTSHVSISTHEAILSTNNGEPTQSYYVITIEPSREALHEAVDNPPRHEAIIKAFKATKTI